MRIPAASASFERPFSLRLSRMLVATLVVGSLDLLTCSLYWGARGVSPARVAQGAAAWVMGADAYRGGTQSTMLGLSLLYLLALATVAGYRWLSMRDARLLRAPLRAGGLYGAMVFSMMTFVLIPLSAAPNSSGAHVDWLLVLLAIYVFAIGMPTALMVRWMRSTR